MAKRAPVAAVSVSVYRGDEVLLIKRAKPPLHRQWTPPGGVINWRERAVEAAKREVLEEAGVVCEPFAVIDVLDWVLKESIETHHVLICYAARWISGDPAANSDAEAAAFYKLDDVEKVLRIPEIVGVIRAGAALVDNADFNRERA